MMLLESLWNAQALVPPRPLTSTSSWRPCQWQAIHPQWSTLPSHNCLRLQTQLQGDTPARDLPSLCVAEARYLWFQKWVRWGNEGSTVRLRTAGLRVSPLGWRGVRVCVEWLLLVPRGHLHRLPWSRDTHHWRHQDLQNRARDLGTAGLEIQAV